MNRVLLAGASGNIGFFLYNSLKEKNNVIPTSRYTHLNKEFIPLDLSDLASVKNFVKNLPKINTLIFLIGLAHKKGKGKDLNTFRTVNVSTLRNLLSSLKEKNKLPSKIIFASTISVYGEKMDSEIYVEDHNCNPQSPYAITKREAENFLLSEFPNQSWILRFAPVYDDSFTLNIDRRTKTGGMYYKVGNGQTKLSLCHLENIYLAISGILDEKVPTGIYNISDNKEYNYNELLSEVNAGRVLPVPKIFVKLVYYIGNLMNNIFLTENSIKLLSDNVFPSKKIRNYIDLPASLNE